jgi:hypothetical protein
VSIGQLQDSVVYIGVRDVASATGMSCQSMAFLVNYDGHGYLVAPRRAAHGFHDDAFVIRANQNGRGTLYPIARTRWHYHPERGVDLAVTKLTLPIGATCHYFDKDLVLTAKRMDERHVEVGEPCLTLGLFRHFKEDEPNLPYVFSGVVSLLPPTGTLLPIVNEETEEAEYVEAYLVETRARRDSSGAPVFVETHGAGGATQFHLIGIFQEPMLGRANDDIGKLGRAKQPGSLVPFGVGFVTPAYRLGELLELPAVVDERNRPTLVA